MTPASIIADARPILNDTVEEYRYATNDLLGYVNDAIKQAAILRPDLFSTIGDYVCIPGQCEQSLDFEDAVTLVEVLSHHGGNAILPFDLMSMNAFNPGWRGDTAGPATQWSKFADDPLKFFVYPKAPVAQSIDVRYVRRPGSYGLNDAISEIPDVYKPALVDYVVGMAESRDDEHVVSQRAAQFITLFTSRLKG